MPTSRASHPANGLAAEGKPALIRKLCSNLLGSRDNKYAVFNASLCFIQEGVNTTDRSGNGETFAFVRAYDPSWPNTLQSTTFTIKNISNSFGFIISIKFGRDIVT